MHEVSVAQALVELIRRYLPAHHRLIRATVRIGPMHGVVAEAMQLAWQVVSIDAGWPQSTLVVNDQPWRLRCVACGRCWEPATVDEPCQCGCTRVEIMGGDEFQLDSIEVDNPTPHSGHKSRHPAPAAH
jgi:hydrogenase nickel insertion protein HypA